MSEIVQVEITEIRPDGLKATILGDGRSGYVRDREISWERRISQKTASLKPGDRCRAVILEDSRSKNAPVLLSLRQITDPWGDVANRYLRGSVVRGEVVQIRQFGVFVQLEPGVDAVIRANNIPLQPKQRIEEMFKLGDQVQGIVTGINHDRRLVYVSIVRHLQQLTGIPPEERVTLQTTWFRSDQLRLEDPDADSDQSAGIRRYHPPLPRLERILVIDDDGHDLDKIVEYLRFEYRVRVDGVQTPAAALETVSHGISYDLAIVDINLKGVSGWDVAKELLTTMTGLVIIFISGDPLADLKPPSILGKSFPFVLKSRNQQAFLDDLCGKIDKQLQGYWEVTSPSHGGLTSKRMGLAEQMETLAFDKYRSLPETLEQMVVKLRRESAVSQVILVAVDPINRAASIAAVDPPLRKTERNEISDGLYFSPVRNVAEYGEEFLDTEIDPYSYYRGPQYQYFFPGLIFRSCLGLPIHIPHSATKYAIFFLDKGERHFSSNDVQELRYAIKFMQAAMERAVLVDLMLRYEQRYMVGELFGSMVHELSNKFNTLGIQISTLGTLVNRLQTSPDGPEGLKYLNQAGNLMMQMKSANQEVDNLLSAYSQMSRNQVDKVDVLAVVRKVKEQLATKAAEAGVEINIQHQESSLSIRGLAIHLEQIVMNLTLNAIQHTGRYRNDLKMLKQNKPLPHPFEKGYVLLEIMFHETDTNYPIKILVSDTGPGIHFQDYERIFQLDVSTRHHGHGLGLYVSRNLADFMGGRLRLVDSIRYIGSQFVVEFPAMDHDGD